MTLKVKVNKTFFTWVSECLSRPTEADLTLADDVGDEFFVDIFRRDTSPENVADDAVDDKDNVDDDDWPESQGSDRFLPNF